MRDWEALNEPVEKYVIKDFLMVEEEATVREVAVEMKSRGHTSVLVARGGRPTGIVTERDILYRVVAEGRDPNATKIGEIMSSPLITISPRVKLSEAITVMASNHIRRLVVVEGKKVIGILTLMALMGGLTTKVAILPEVERESVSCPYCGARFRSPHELSRHIDNVHVGAEVLSRKPMEW
ncbi:MAG: CBS domain-containing protein [Aigarchaeota archaeon]|nr:CBS domain-containing protein [Candidatus Calditenuaceae archaeon]